MSESDRIADQLRRAYKGRAWHGPPLRDLLDGVTAAQAAAHPLPGVHSIWEILLHVIAWQDAARRRIAGEHIPTLPEDQNWPPVPEPSATAWKQALDQLAQSYEQIHQAVTRFPAERLDDILPSKESVYGLLHGVIQHNLYHAGQIAILKKAASASVG
jgi:uncharacterized damage-inducible protein DinB